MDEVQNIAGATDLIDAIATRYPSFYQQFSIEGPLDPSEQRLVYMEASCLARYLIAQVCSGQNPKSVYEILEIFETAYRSSSDKPFREWIVVGLIEDLSNHCQSMPGSCQAIYAMLPPSLKRAWDAVEDFWQGRTPRIIETN